ncbi:MAG TPA: hypothetical protein VH679_12165 [Vicinamibacterales bacterium]|jgi:hypothetical protein
MPSKILPVPYHRQERVNYCGAACLQMVIEALSGSSKDQDDLYIDSHESALDPKTNWYSAPDGVEETLDAIKGRQRDFDLAAFSQESTLTRRLVWSVFNASVAPIVLVYGWAHWLVVVGYDISQNPSGPTDTSYTITALELHDPWRGEGEGNPPPPPPPRHVAYSEWLNKYLKPVPDGYWSGKRIAVGEFVDPKRKGAKKETSSGTEALPLMMGSTPKPIISAGDAAGFAKKGLEQYGLLQRADWQPLLDQPAAPSQSVLVQRLDVAGGYYYLVPLTGGGHKTEAVVRVDGFSGDYLEASAIGVARDGRSWSALAAGLGNEELVRRRLVGQKLELPDDAGRILIRSEGLGVHPSFVWKPCVESQSPYYPFRVVTIGDLVRYIRVDGAVFDALHDAGPGM